MVSRFESCVEFNNVSLHLIELRKKKKNLGDELLELKKINSNNHDHVMKIKRTKQKYDVVTKLLDELDSLIENFNHFSKETNIPETDKADEFWFTIQLASCVLHKTVENLHILVGYRDLSKPAAGMLPAAAMAVGMFFAAPLFPSAVSALVAFAFGLRLTSTLGYSKATDYMGFPDSFRLFAKLTDELSNTALQMKPYASLPNTLTTADIEGLYQRLGLESGASSETITASMEEKMGQLRQELITLNSRSRPPTPDDDGLRAEIAAKIVGIMQAGVTASLHAMRNPKITHKMV